jgi:hypothetical protein
MSLAVLFSRNEEKKRHQMIVLRPKNGGKSTIFHQNAPWHFNAYVELIDNAISFAVI